MRISSVLFVTTDIGKISLTLNKKITMKTAKKWLIEKYPEMKLLWNATDINDEWVAGQMQEYADYVKLTLPVVGVELKEKYKPGFEEFVNNKVNTRPVGNIYWYKDIGYLSLDDLFKTYNKIKDNL